MPNIFYYSLFFSDGGYQQAASSNVIALNKYIEKNNIDCKVIPLNPEGYNSYKNEEVRILYEKNKDTMPRDDDYLLVHKQPFPYENKDVVLGGLYSKIRRKIYVTVFECSDIPLHFIPILNNYDRIIVPSTFCKDAFSISIDHAKVKVVPHVIYDRNIKEESIIIDDNGSTLLRDSNDNKCVFLSSISQVTDRKGMDLLLKAYLSGFNLSDKVELILHAAPLRGKNDVKRVDDFVTGVKNAFFWKKDKPNITTIVDFLTDGQMITLYKYADFFISTSRGEGFGLQIPEAMICGTPVIFPYYGGFLEYMISFDRDNPIHNIFPFRFKGISAAGIPIEVMEDTVISTTYPYDIGYAKWGEPKISSIIDAMKHANFIYFRDEEYKYIKDSTKDIANHLLDKYSHENIGSKIWQVISEIQ